MRLRILKIITVITIVAGLIYFNGGFNSLFKPSTAFAVGDLSVDWGVPEGNPIFVVNNFAPGQIETRIVVATNSASAARPVGLRGSLTSETASLSGVLDFVVKDGGTDVYGGGSSTGPKTLAQFFSESASISGVPLSIIAPGGTKDYSFKVTFQNSAGNEFQNAHLVFDLTIGIFFEVPPECGSITFPGSPIFGTEGNDKILGTNKNDLIIGFFGKDIIDGGNGKDCIIAGDGNNILDGGNGDDVIVAGDGNNSIAGGNGKDSIFTGDGNNKIDGGNGDDKINTGSGTDNIKGGNGADQIDAGGGNDMISGGNGNDSLVGGLGADSADGGNGMDTCDGETETHCEL